MQGKPALLDRFAYHEQDSAETRFSKKLILVVVLCCCLCGLAWGSIYCWFLGFGPTAVLPFVFVLLVSAVIPIAHAQRNHLPLVYAQLICITWIPTLIQWSLGSLNDSGVVIAWCFLSPVGALLFLDRKHSYFWMAKFMLIVLVSVLWQPQFSTDALNLSGPERGVFYIMNLCFPALVVFGAAFYFVSNLMQQKDLNMGLLEVAKHRNKKIQDSITYAKRIQQAKLPDIREINKIFSDSFILFKPKDIVSGDFYYLYQKQDLSYVAAADCTGHGVPGAFMSLICFEKLDAALETNSHPSDVLASVNKGIKSSLKQSASQESTRDGMDIALCAIDTDTKQLHYAGANRPLWIIRKGANAVEEHKATKRAIGGFTDDNQAFEPHTIPYEKGDMLYLFSDGYADTFSAADNKKLTTKKFKDLLLSVQHKSMREQEHFLDAFIEEWKGGNEPIDDILVIGIRL